jgi:hypothetical protein
MSQTPSLRETIDEMLASNKVPSIGGQYVDHKKQEDATAVDRAFLESWRNDADDSIWPSTLATIRTCYRPYTPYVWMVARALRANRMAEGAHGGVDIVFERRQKERRECLDLADKAEALANHFGGLDEETTAWYDGLLPVRELVKLHKKEASILRERAGEEPQPTVPVIRQNRRGSHIGLRARRALIQLIAKEVDQWTQGNAPVGFNRFETIVAFVRIRFPEVDADVVRKSLEPTTREGRRQWRADAHKRKSKPLAVNELPAWADALSRGGADTSDDRSQGNMG